MDGNYEIKNYECVCDYKTRIIDFDGPLDLLLQLVKRAKIEIKDIFVSEVTDQFLSYLDTMEFFDIEKASEYAGFATALVYEKSKALLPKIEEEIEEIDDGGSIITSLEELALFKAMSEKLKMLENVNRYLAVIVSAVVCPVVNTGIFLLGCLIFFMDTVKGFATVEGISVGAYLILFFVGLNFVFELLANIILSPAILRIINIKKRN